MYFCRNAHMNIIVIIMSYICIVMRSIFCQLPSCNLFTQYVSYLLWRDTTSELWTPVHSSTLIKPPFSLRYTITCSLFLFAFIFILHTIRLILCIQQAGEIDNLPVSLGQSSLIVLCAGPRQPSIMIMCIYSTQIILDMEILPCSFQPF